MSGLADLLQHGFAVRVIERSLEQSLAAFALHALWQVPLLAGAAWLAVRIGRPGVRTTHVLWSLTLGLCVLMPAVATIGGRRAALEAERAAANASVSYSTSDYSGVLPELQREPLWKRVLRRHISNRGVQPFSFALPSRIARAIALLYLLIVACFAMRLVLAWRRSGWLVRRAESQELPSAVVVALHRQCELLNIAEPPVSISADIAGPALAGVRKPTLLLPATAAEQMSPAEVDAVLAHELAHLRRRDPLMHAVSSLLLIPVGFHPAAVWVARRVRQTREMACDAEAARQMGSAASYARALLQVAERTGRRPAHVAGLGLFTTGLGFLGTSLELFGAGGAMEERMETLMHGQDQGSNRHRMLRAGVGIGLGAVAVLAAAMVQVQPALAASQDAAFAGAAAKPAADRNDEQQKLIGGDHAREQLRNARRQLSVAEQNASTDEERSKIATARELASVAEQQIAAASGHDRPSATIHIDKMPSPLDLQQLKKLEDLSRQMAVQVHPNADTPGFQITIDNRNAALNEKLRAQMERLRAAAEKMRVQSESPEWKAQMEQQRAAMDKLRAQFNSPEWKAYLAKVHRLDSADIQAQLEKAQQYHALVIQQFNSGEMQRQIDEATRNIAHLEVPEFPPVTAINAPNAQTPKVAKVASAVMAGNLLPHENPVYPPEAKEKHIQGAVVLHAMISEAGTVESLQVVSSPDPLLSKASVEAVQKWTYRPYLLNGNPTAVETTITVTFSFGA